MAHIEEYTQLVTSEHQKPKMLAMVAALAQGFVDLRNAAYDTAGLFDLDTAVGDQLDTLGEYVGIARNVTLIGNASSVHLEDDDYRFLLTARVAANQWNGSSEGAYLALAQAFNGTGIQFGLFDGQDGSYQVLVYSGTLTPLQLALLEGNYLLFKPGGIRNRGYFRSSVEGDTIFGFDYETSTIAGWDTGAWAVAI